MAKSVRGGQQRQRQRTMRAGKRPTKKDEPAVYFMGGPGGRGAGSLALKQAVPIIQSPSRDVEDEFARFNEVLGPKGGTIQPPFDMVSLERLVQENSILVPLVHAMETNVECTGADIVPRDPVEVEVAGGESAEEETEDDAAADGDKPSPEEQRQAKEEEERRQASLEEFFAEPWPGMSFRTIRRKLRRDQERIGNAYLEGVRNLRGDLVACKWVEGKTIRLVRKDEPVEVERTVIRNGRPMTLLLQMRERRYVQVVGGKLSWFKDWGASRDLDKETGDWAPLGSLPRDRRATELLHFTVDKDIYTSYGVPRWISNVPSVVGSRMAELFNLDFFDSGGIPPLLIIVQGGKLASDVQRALSEHFTATGPTRHTAAILEAFSTGGDIDAPDRVRVTVERFGSERQNDSMFEKYQETSERKIRRSFRLGSIFLGMSDDVSFATAFASATVAESQVFKPERDEFDEMVNLHIMPELPHGDEFEYRSRPLVTRTAELQLKGVELANTAGVAGRESLREAINEVTSLELEAPDAGEMAERMEEAQNAAVAAAAAGRAGQPAGAAEQKPEGQAPSTTGGQGQRQPSRQASAKKDEEGAEALGLPSLPPDSITGLHALAESAAEAARLERWEPELVREVVEQVRTLQPAELQVFKALLAVETFPVLRFDPEGAADLSMALWEALARRADA